jgi:DNA adenine methylase
MGDNAPLTPPLKWAGGKRWLAKRHPELIPEKYRKYREPFLGGGAMFFHNQPKISIISDKNPDLIALYNSMKENCIELRDRLDHHAKMHSKDYFYKIRSNKPSEDIELASWLLYLNRTCYNGLYRVNRRGEFNVPIGTKTSVKLPTDDFPAISRALKHATIKMCDFSENIDNARNGDFIFADPPYTVKHNKNGFLKYNENIFSWSDQERLMDCLLKASRRGVKILVSNANHKSVRDLYEGIGEVLEVSRHSVIGGGNSYRAPTTEIVVKIGY